MGVPRHRPPLPSCSPGTSDLRRGVPRLTYQRHALALLENSALTFPLLETCFLCVFFPGGKSTHCLNVRVKESCTHLSDWLSENFSYLRCCFLMVTRLKQLESLNNLLPSFDLWTGVESSSWDRIWKLTAPQAVLQQRPPKVCFVLTFGCSYQGGMVWNKLKWLFFCSAKFYFKGLGLWFTCGSEKRKENQTCAMTDKIASFVSEAFID